MANRNALPIFSTSKVDSGLLLREINSPRRIASPRRILNISGQTPLSSRQNGFKTPSSLNSSRQKWKSASAIDSGQPKTEDKCRGFKGSEAGHICSPSLSPRSSRPISKFCSDSALNSSPTLDTSAVGTPTSPHGETSNCIVGVRVRPFSCREEKDKSVRNVVSMKSNEVRLTCASGTVHLFTYDHCLWSFSSDHQLYTSQQDLFTTMAEPLLTQVMCGYNACLLAYGQTGSGKSYSMMGPDSGGEDLSDDVGIIPRFCKALFERAAEKQDTETRVEMSYYEVYNEKIHDLLSSHKDGIRQPLRVRENPNTGPYVVDLAVHGVSSYSHVKDWLTVGNSHRITAATAVNEKSSRSHSIFSLSVTQTKDGVTCRSRANLVDLAGSERVALTASSDHQLKEGVSINKSLLTLGKVIAFLSERGKRRSTSSFGPYRESVLTWLLKDSLGGNSKTAMLATISPANVHMDETLATLRYACQARAIVNRVHPNEDANERIIRELRMELEKMSSLQTELEKLKELTTSDDCDKQLEIDQLKVQLKEAQEKLAKEQQPWEEKVQASSARVSEELRYLLSCGVAVDSTQQHPCLVTLSLDPMLSNTLLYPLPPGRNTVGRSPGADIVLHSPLVAQRHCVIENAGGRLLVRPIIGAETFVNGVAVTRDAELMHSDRLAIAGVHLFWLRVKMSSDTPPVDFEQAQKELKREQEARLRSELRAEMDAAHAQELQGVLNLLDAQTSALQSEQTHEVESEAPAVTSVPTYSSTFLDDLYAIIARSRDSKNLSLLDIHLLVREATERCRDLGINLEFHQEQLVKESGLTPVVRVIDIDKNMFSIWKHSDFFVFLDAVREADDKEVLLQAISKMNADWEISSDVTRQNKRISVNRQKNMEFTITSAKPVPFTLEEMLQDLQQQEMRLKMASESDEVLRHQLEKALPHFQAFIDALSVNECAVKSVRFSPATSAST